MSFLLTAQSGLLASMPPTVRDLVGRALCGGRTVQVANSFQDLEPFVCPSPTDVYSVIYDDLGGEPFGEAVVTRATNVLAVNFPDPRMRKRPSHPRAITIGDEGQSCQMHVREAYSVEPQAVLNGATTWLANQDLLCVVLRCGPEVTAVRPQSPVNLADDWAYMRTLMVLPHTSAWLPAAMSIIHGIEPLRADGTLPPLEGVILGAYGLRKGMFRGEQTAVHFRRARQPTIVIANGSYPGHGAKKTMMGLAIAKEAAAGSFLHHAAVTLVECPGGGTTTFMLIAPSGGGKTEVAQKLPPGEVLIARWRNGTSVLLLPSQCEPHPVCDDIWVMPPWLQQGSGRGTGFSFERGLFNRVNDANRRGVLPVEDAILAAAKQDVLVVNFHASPGQVVETHDHAREENGAKNTNPRMIHANGTMPGWVNGAHVIDTVAYGVTCVETTADKPFGAVLGLWHAMPAALMWAFVYAGPRASASVSQDGAVGNEPLCTEPFGTCSPFATVPRRELGLNLFRQIASWWATNMLVLPVKYIGDRAVGFSPARLAREAHARKASGTAKWKLEPARAPFLGRHVMDLEIAGNWFAIGLEDVSRQGQLGEAGYDRAAAYLHGVCWKELALLRTDFMEWLGEDGLTADDQQWINLALAVIAAWENINTPLATYDDLSERMHRAAGRP